MAAIAGCGVGCDRTAPSEGDPAACSAVAPAASSSAVPAAQEEPAEAAAPSDAGRTAGDASSSTVRLTRQVPRRVNWDICSRSPVLVKLFRSGLARRRSPQLIELSLHFDHNFASCSAPDSYGNDVIARLRVQADDKRCLVTGAEVATRPWGEEVERDDDGVLSQGHGSVPFEVVPAMADFADPGLRELRLRNIGRKKLLRIMRDDVLFYLRYVPAEKLVGHLQGETDPSADNLLYPVTMSPGAWNMDNWLPAPR